MIFAFIILGLLLILTLWKFFTLSPKNANPKDVLRYNIVTVLIALGVSIGMTLQIRASMINGSDSGWWPILSFISSLILMIITFFILGILRNHLFFRK